MALGEDFLAYQKKKGQAAATPEPSAAPARAPIGDRIARFAANTGIARAVPGLGAGDEARMAGGIPAYQREIVSMLPGKSARQASAGAPVTHEPGADVKPFDAIPGGLLARMAAGGATLGLSEGAYAAQDIANAGRRLWAGGGAGLEQRPIRSAFDALTVAQPALDAVGAGAVARVGRGAKAVSGAAQAVRGAVPEAPRFPAFRQSAGGPFRATSVRGAEAIRHAGATPEVTRATLSPLIPESRDAARNAATADPEAGLRRLMEAAIPDETHPVVTEGSVALNRMIDDILTLPEAERSAAFAERVTPGIRKLSEMATPHARGLAAFQEFDPSNPLTAIRKVRSEVPTVTPEQEIEIARRSAAIRATIDPTEKVFASGRLEDYSSGLKPKTVLEKHRALLRMGLLAQLRSPLRQVLSQGLSSAVEEGIVRPLMPLGEKIVEALAPASRGIRVSSGAQPRAFFRGAKEGAVLGTKVAKQNIVGNEGINPFATGESLVGRGRSFRGPVMGRIEQGVAAMYQVPDTTQRMATQRASIADLEDALRGSGINTSDAKVRKGIERSVDREGLQSVFQDTDRWPTKASRAIADVPVLGSMVNVFPTAPVNVAVRGVYDYAPGGLGAIKSIRDVRHAPADDIAEMIFRKRAAARQVARGIFGTGAAVAGAAGAGTGAKAYLTGERHPSAKVQAARDEAGHPARSLATGKGSIRTAPFAPITVPANVGAAAREAFRRKGSGLGAGVESAATGAVDVLGGVVGEDVPSLRNLGRILGGGYRSPGAALKDTVASFVAAHVPGIVSHVAQGLDTKQRAPKADSIGDKIAQAVEMRVPGLRQNVPEKKSPVTKKSLPSPSAKLPAWLRVLESTAQPIARSKATDSGAERRARQAEREYEARRKERLRRERVSP